ncbi:hypothetical protein BX666DRAFT_1837656, partial [Dichotomocladium elegans]
RAHTVLWRTFHRYLPNRTFVHHLAPSSFPSPGCPIGGEHDTIEHFLCSCPSKVAVWNLLAPSYLSLNHIRLLNRPNLAWIHLSTSVFWAYDIMAIWRAHW